MTTVIHPVAEYTDRSFHQRDGSDYAAIVQRFPGARIIEPVYVHGSFVHYIVEYATSDPQTINVKRRWDDTPVTSDGHPYVAIETVSVKTPRIEDWIPGWTIDRSKVVDWILYTFKPSVSDRTYMFPYRTLRAVSLLNLDKWRRAYREKETLSHRPDGSVYRSSVIFVPGNVVQVAISRFDPLESRLLL